MKFIMIFLICICPLFADSFNLNRSEAFQNKLKQLKIESKNNNIDSQFKLAMTYFRGWNLPRSKSKTLYWLNKSAEKDNQFAKYMLGTFYYYGMLVDKNKALGKKMIKDSFEEIKVLANKNNPYAQYIIGRIHTDNQIIKENSEIAKNWFIKSANNDCLDAQIELGISHYVKFRSESDEQAYSESIKWFNMAAKQNCSEAQYWMYILLTEKKENRENNKENLSWLTKAAGQGYTYAESSLADEYMRSSLYLGKHEASKLKRKASMLFTNAASKGDRNAQFALAEMYEKNEPVKAYIWLCVYQLTKGKEKPYVLELNQSERITKKLKIRLSKEQLLDAEEKSKHIIKTVNQDKNKDY